MDLIVNKVGEVIAYGNDVSIFNDKYLIDGVLNTFINVGTSEVYSYDVDDDFYINTWMVANGNLVKTSSNKIIPQTLTPRQFRLALLQVGLLDDVEAMIAQSREHQIYFEYSLDFERNHPLLVTMASAMGLSDAQIDDLFVLGWAL